MDATGMAAGETLARWEQVDGLAPLRRGPALAAYAGSAADAVVGRPVGHYHARLLELRCASRSGPLEATAVCPHCGARVEFVLDPRELLAVHEAAQGREHDVDVPPPVTGWHAPTVADLDDLGQLEDPVTTLLRRCVTVADGAGDVTALPEAVLDAIEEAMMAADPLAEVLVSLTCPDCREGFDSSVDLADFVWSELDARARRTLHEVDVLARAYGWTEAQVLALSEARRAAYLRLVLEGAP